VLLRRGDDGDMMMMILMIVGPLQRLPRLLGWIGGEEEAALETTMQGMVSGARLLGGWWLGGRQLPSCPYTSVTYTWWRPEAKRLEG
jgi:hypothetical protein